mgnify:FL=1|jgi:hypothetical protein
MHTVNTKKLREKFKNAGVQLSATSINVINDHIDREISKMAQRCKDGNVKRLTPELFWIALGRYNARDDK